MAPLSFTLATPISSSPIFSQTIPPQPRLKTHARQTHHFKVSCNASSNDQDKRSTTNAQPQKLILPQTSLDWQNVDRRNLLLGLGGATASLNGLPSAFADAIKAPPVDVNPTQRSCVNARSGFKTDKPPLVRTAQCCPPTSKYGTETDYILPDGEPIRIREPLHSLSPEYVEKFRYGINEMIKLPDDDPRSFTNQAKVHCAYCNGSYTQNGKQLQIHNSWLFYPFHRWYLYFFERILGHFVGDPTFGLPYWNWDNPSGMLIPDFVLAATLPNSKETNPLYDKNRSAEHQIAMINLDFPKATGKITGKRYTQTDINLVTMKKQMMRNAFDAKSFFGGKYVAGSDIIQGVDPSVGSIEAGCHTSVHRWVGNSENYNNEDMGNFYSAGYDPLFYLHHSNVDRMWTLWKDMKIDGEAIPGHKEPESTDWEDASYVFFDENQKAVRVTNRDSVNLDKVKYVYKESPTTYWETQPVISKCNRSPTKVSDTKLPGKESETNVDLSKTLSFQLKRPAGAKDMSAKQKKTVKEVLCLYGINYNGMNNVKFDVLVNDCGESGLEFYPCDAEFAGSFAAIAHLEGDTMVCKSGARFGLNELLEEIGATDQDSVRVTFKPADKESKQVIIDKIEIKLIDVSSSKYI